MRIPLAMLVCLLTSSLATAETLEFAIYKLSDKGQELVAEGKRNYTLSDIEVTPLGIEDGHQNSRKALHLKDGFTIGIFVTRRYEEDGFGMSIREDYHPDGFSWEWFIQEKDNVFMKLQEEGRLRLTHIPVARGLEIRSIEFLTDVTLRFQQDRSQDARNSSHEVVVYKGSVLRIAP